MKNLRGAEGGANGGPRREESMGLDLSGFGVDICGCCALETPNLRRVRVHCCMTLATAFQCPSDIVSKKPSVIFAPCIFHLAVPERLCGIV